MLIQILLFIMALLLLVIGYFLIFKTTIALQLLKPKEDLASVLSDYGKFFVIGGILGIVCTFIFLQHKNHPLCYIYLHSKTKKEICHNISIIFLSFLLKKKRKPHLI